MFQTVKSARILIIFPHPIKYFIDFAINSYKKYGDQYTAADVKSDKDALTKIDTSMDAVFKNIMTKQTAVEDAVKELKTDGSKPASDQLTEMQTAWAAMDAKVAAAYKAFTDARSKAFTEKTTAATVPTLATPEG